MTFIADLHVHSRYSRATSKKMDLEHLYVAAQIKGIRLVGTGDFTHPQWFAELREKLELDADGLLKLRPDIAAACDASVPAVCRQPVRFMLQTEISNIYKKKDKTRKNHNLVYLPDFETAEKFNATLDRLGNIRSDGRPILGLDARDLLEILLETSGQGMLIPAHIWTPWFSLLGSKSGFDTVTECFEDLSGHIAAVETGLSSDPPMNWRVSGLDGMTLVSNSDAHSPWKLGREATLFKTAMSYTGVMDAIRSGRSDQFGGTIEFYPEEGKYHLDGHRKCQVRLDPEASRRLDNRCPVCGKELTLGVFNRVLALSDRRPGALPDNTHPYTNMVPLTHILGEVFRVGSESRKVRRHYEAITQALGSELSVLLELPLEDVAGMGIPLLDEAVSRVRNGQLHIAGGYDGVFGTISIFTEEERSRRSGQQGLFTGQCLEMPTSDERPSASAVDTAGAEKSMSAAPLVNRPQANGLNPEQAAAVNHASGPLIIVAGPGTGKTFTLTRRIAHLIHHRKVAADRILAITFTRKAAGEMTQRLERLLTPSAHDAQPHVATFHGFCHDLLSAATETPFSIIADEDRLSLVKTVLTDGGSECQTSLSARAALQMIITAKQRLLGPNDDFSDILSGDVAAACSTVYQLYQERLELQQLLDYEDLIRLVVTRLEADPSFRENLRRRFSHVLVDEYQDINHGQYRLIRALCPPRSQLCVIGDPDQSIYGFRGSSHRYFKSFTADYPDAAVVRLNRNYRNTPAILSAAYQVVEKQRHDSPRERPSPEVSSDRRVTVIETDTDRSEAVAIGMTIERLVGGTGFQSMDFGVVNNGETDSAVGFGDVAVLVRTHAQTQTIEDVFSNHGIPCRRVSRSRVMDNREVMKLLSLFRLVNDRGGIADLARVISVIAPGISPATLGTVTAWCFSHGLSVKALRYSVRQYPVDGLSPRRQQRLYDFLGVPFRLRRETETMSVSAALAYIITHSRLKKSFSANGENEMALADLLAAADGYGNDRNAFIAAAALHTDADHLRRSAEKVSIMTIHAAKGLEFPVVFVAGCDAGILPFQPPGGRMADVDEERRLFFVAATRAKEHLFLCSARRRIHQGRRIAFNPSPFIGDIEKRLKTVSRWHKTPAANPAPRQLNLF
jgi:DNA helicase-2/ATP-dependent DNA helicase PcrA